MPGGPARKKGGYRKPAAPAPVSGPGALAQRTDGGASQPVRPIPSSGPGSTIGDRQASVAMQQAAPLAAVAPPAGAPGAVAPPTAPGAPGQPMDPFGPTNRPYEPVTAGAALGAGPGAPSESQTAADVLRGVLAAHPEASASITALLEQLDA